MKKNLLLLLISITIVSLLQAQELTFNWAKKVNGDIISNAPITKIANKSVFVGTSKQGGANSIVMDKYNLTGKLLATYSYIISGENSVLKDFSVDASGNIYLCGQATISGGTANTQGFLAKLNAAGTLAWQQLFNNKNGLDEANRVRLDNSNNVYCSENSNNVAFTASSAYVYKYSTAGNLLNQYTNTNSKETIADMSVTSSGNVAVCGGKVNTFDIIDSPYTKVLNSSLVQQWQAVKDNPASDGEYCTHTRFDKLGNVISAVYTYTSYAGMESNLYKYNAAGVQQWEALTVLLGDDMIQGMEMRSDNSVVYTSTDHPELGGWVVVTGAVSAAGNSLWGNQYTTSSGYPAPTCMAVNSADQVFVGGLDNEATAPGANWMVMAIDKNGVLGDVEIYYNTVQTTTYDFVKSIAVSGTNIVAAGYKNGKEIGWNLDSFQNRVIKMNLNILPFKPAENTVAQSATANNAQPFTVQAWPNPATDFTNIILPVSNEKSTISIFNAAGVKVKEIIINAGATRASVMLHTFPAGQYFVQVVNKTNTYKTSFIKN